MNKQYDDNFFDDLDKTTDLLKAFKSHMEVDEISQELDSLDDLYSSIEDENVEKQAETVNIQQHDENDALSIFSKQNVKSSDEMQITKSEVEEIDFSDVKSGIEEINFSDIKSDGIDEIDNTKQLSNPDELMSSNETNKVDINSLIEDISSNELSKKEKINSLKINKKEKKEKESKKKGEKLKFNPLELSFCAFSFLFIVGCIAVYGSRFFKYYKIYNPKSSNGQSLLLLSTEIGKNSPVVYEGNGLYMSGGEYVYKGKDVNNYLRYSNFTWRIIKTNTDGTIDMVMDDYINALPWSSKKSDYVDSDVHKYLNEYFIKYLDTDNLVPTTICTDEINDLKKFTCKNKNEDSYVRLLSVNEFLNSKADGTYISNEKDALWLNTKSSDKVWQVNGLNLSQADQSRALGIKPVVRLKATAAVLGGEGTKEKPYYLEEEKKELHVGSYVTLGSDTYVIYDTDSETISLALNRVLPKKYYFDKQQTIYNPSLKTSLAYLLNLKFYNILPYKDLLVEKEWNIGTYNNSYKDVESNKVKAKIGMLNVTDLKFNNQLQDYYLANSIYGKVGLYGVETIGSQPTVRQWVRPTICIKKMDIKEGDGSLEKPFKLGV